MNCDWYHGIQRKTKPYAPERLRPSQCTSILELELDSICSTTSSGVKYHDLNDANAITWQTFWELAT